MRGDCSKEFSARGGVDVENVEHGVRGALNVHVVRFSWHQNWRVYKLSIFTLNLVGNYILFTLLVYHYSKLMNN